MERDSSSHKTQSRVTRKLPMMGAYPVSWREVCLALDGADGATSQMENDDSHQQKQATVVDAAHFTNPTPCQGKDAEAPEGENGSARKTPCALAVGRPTPASVVHGAAPGVHVASRW
ncbi:hypothetical protein PV04_09607 [Phialophora macrospora]|uniref:Uncharacterized protein n=1 Tax=Phialophora macrospora TaxID=1851006 RepID=A0A0D2FXP3_9EURO|nr:hypothetical protein PV04_09607 [Phialophora macrospora]